MADRETYERMADRVMKATDIGFLNRGQYMKLQIVLEERRRVAALENRLKDVEKIDYVSQQITDYYNEGRLYASKAERVMTADYQTRKVTERLATAEDNWAGKISEMRRKQKRDNERITREGEEALQNFDASTPSSLPPRFRKYSAELLNLHDRKRHAIISKDLESATKLDQQIKELQKVEEQQQRQRFYESNERRRKLLEQRTQRRLNAKNTDWETTISQTEHMQRREILPLRQGVQNLTSKTATAKAEYIGEDDLILKECSQRGLTAQPRDRTLKRTTRPMKRGIVDETTKHKSDMIKKSQVRFKDSDW